LRWINALGSGDETIGPLPSRLVVANLLVRLLGAGVWDEEDHSWRHAIETLLTVLGPDADKSAETEPAFLPETEQRRRAVVAVLMTLLGEGATFTGGSEHDVQAAHAWRSVRAMIAKADPDDASDLMLLPEQARAHVASWSDVADLVSLAQDDDPYAEVVAELTAAGWSVVHEAGLWEVTGSFGNPVPVAAKAADRLGRHSSQGVLIRAVGHQRWTLAAWAAPHLVLLNYPAKVWSTYKIQSPATPESRFSSGDLSSIPGLVGVRAPLASGVPPGLEDILAGAGMTCPELIRRLFPNSD
jgi:hypothetical protein